MYRLLINIFVSIFIIKSKRVYVKQYLLSIKNRIRIRKKAKSIGENFTCSGMAEITVNKNTIIKDNVKINGLTVYGSGDVIIGNWTHIASDCIIISDNHNYEGDAIPYDSTVIRKMVEIEDFVWIGVRCTILPGTKIGEGAIIQAGSVVRGEIPAYSICGGNPAKVFKTRDIEHFLKLKEEKKFY